MAEVRRLSPVSTPSVPSRERMAGDARSEVVRTRLGTRCSRAGCSGAAGPALYGLNHGARLPAAAVASSGQKSAVSSRPISGGWWVPGRASDFASRAPVSSVLLDREALGGEVEPRVVALSLPEVLLSIPRRY